MAPVENRRNIQNNVCVGQRRGPWAAERVRVFLGHISEIRAARRIGDTDNLEEISLACTVVYF